MDLKGKHPSRGSVRPGAEGAFEYPQPRLPGDDEDFWDESDPLAAGREDGTDGAAQAAVRPRSNNVIPFRPRQARQGD